MAEQAAPDTGHRPTWLLVSAHRITDVHNVGALGLFLTVHRTAVHDVRSGQQLWHQPESVWRR